VTEERSRAQLLLSCNDLGRTERRNNNLLDVLFRDEKTLHIIFQA